jgi:hypothetical protein
MIIQVTVLVVITSIVFTTYAYVVRVGKVPAYR